MAKAKGKAAEEDAADANGSTHSESYTASLKVNLSPGEIADRADRAAQMVAERDAKEEEHKAAAKHSKSVIEALDAEIRRLSNEVRTRSTYAQVECRRVYDYEGGRFREIRTDTGETIGDRPLTDSERQRRLPFAGGGGPPDDG
jgi:hypothetical protein